MRRRLRLGAVLVAGLALGGCGGQAATRLPDPSQVAVHEWDHGPPWGPEEIPWVSPPQVFAYGPAPWGPTVGLGLGFGRGYWWRGHRGFRGGFHHRGGFRGGHGGGRGRR